MTMGRPTKYKPEYAQQLLDYFGATQEAYREVIDSRGRVQLVANPIPTFQRFAGQIGVCNTTLYHWSTCKSEAGEPKHPDFLNAYARAKTYQAALMLEGGMVGALNPSFTGLAMKNLHDWRDKLETETTHSGQIDLQAIEADLQAAAAKRQEWAEEANERIRQYST